MIDADNWSAVEQFPEDFRELLSTKYLKQAVLPVFLVCKRSKKFEVIDALVG